MCSPGLPFTALPVPYAGVHEPVMQQAQVHHQSERSFSGLSRAHRASLLFTNQANGSKSQLSRNPSRRQLGQGDSPLEDSRPTSPTTRALFGSPSMKFQFGIRARSARSAVAQSSLACKASVRSGRQNPVKNAPLAKESSTVEMPDILGPSVGTGPFSECHTPCIPCT